MKPYNNVNVYVIYSSSPCQHIFKYFALKQSKDDNSRKTGTLYNKDENSQHRIPTRRDRTLFTLSYSSFDIFVC